MSLPHHNLVAWQRADDLFIEVHRLTHERFPAHEKYELGRQIRKAGFSVPANMVEGIAMLPPHSLNSGTVSTLHAGLATSIRQNLKISSRKFDAWPPHCED